LRRKARSLPVDLVMASPSNGGPWYARRNGTVRGPFTDEYLARYILLGRIRLKDELSQDRIVWRPVRDCQELFPDELRQLSSWEDYQRLVMARVALDERVSQRRTDQGSILNSSRRERRKLSDRRRFDSDAEFLKYHLMGELPGSAHESHRRQSQPLRNFLLATLLATLVFAFFSIYTR
jgi:hypothetical protein